MKTTIFQASVLVTLAVLGICAPATDSTSVASSPPKAVSGFRVEDVNLPATPAGITVKLVPANYTSVNTGPTPRSLDARQQAQYLYCTDVSESPYPHMEVIGASLDIPEIYY